MAKYRKYYFNHEGTIIETVRTGRHRRSKGWCLWVRSINPGRARKIFAEWAEKQWKNKEHDHYADYRYASHYIPGYSDSDTG